MPQVSVDNQPLLDRLMYGYDGSVYRVVKVDTTGKLLASITIPSTMLTYGYGYDGSTWQAIKVNASGNVIVGLMDGQTINSRSYGYTGAAWVAVSTDANGNLTVNWPSTQQVLANAQGYVGSAWQKQPIQFGYTGTVSDTVSSSSLAAGTNNLDFTAVPANTVQTIEKVVYGYVGTVTTVSIMLSKRSGGVDYLVDFRNPVVSNVYFTASGPITLKAGDNIRVTCWNATLNNTMLGYLCGHTMTINL